MNHPNPNQSIRPGVLVVAVGTLAVTVVLAWALKGRPSPTDVAVEAAVPMSPSVSVKPVAALARVKQVVATPVAVNTERPRWTRATRLSMPEMRTDTTSPDAAASLAGFQRTETFDYRAQAAQVAEVVRNAIAQEERRSEAMLPGSATGFAQSQGAGGPFNQAQPGPVGSVPNAIAQPETGGAARSPGIAAQFAGSPGNGPAGFQAQGAPVAESVPNAVTPPELGGYAASPGSAAQVSQGSGPAGGQVVNNAVEAYREGERIRRAYVEEMRAKRVVTIVEARQRGGI